MSRAMPFEPVSLKTISIPLRSLVAVNCAHPAGVAISPAPSPGGIIFADCAAKPAASIPHLPCRHEHDELSRQHVAPVCRLQSQAREHC
jgi:hypothetical protein